jgi:SNF family Na+-dependent transporter
LIVKDGAKTTGKIAVYTALGPFFIFIVLIAYGFTLDGAAEGINYIFKPDWSKLWNSEVWVDANTQVFYQLSIGLGVVSNLSAMKPKREDFLKSVFIVPLSLFLSGILSALTIFMYLSHFSLKSGVSIENLKLSGP